MLSRRWMLTVSDDVDSRAEDAQDILAVFAVPVGSRLVGVVKLVTGATSGRLRSTASRSFSSRRSP